MTATPTRVAILDDDPSVRNALGRLLRVAGMDAVTYAATSQFLDSLALINPDCLILDLQMPGADGWDVLKYLDVMDIRIPTIMITGHDEPGSRERCLSGGASAYLLKPLDADRLIQTIEDVSRPHSVTESET